MRTVFAIVACLFLFAGWVACQDAAAREAGWVPLPREPWKPPLHSSPLPRSAGKSVQPVIPAKKPGATVYDRQPLVTEAELVGFLPLLPRFRAWARRNNETARPIVNAAGKPDFSYSPKAAEWVAGHGFEPARFFCIMGRMAAGLAIIEEGNDLASSRPRDMPPVDQKEIDLARRHLGELLTAASMPVN